MRKYLLSLVVAMSLVGCGSSGSGDTKTSGTVDSEYQKEGKIVDSEKQTGDGAVESKVGSENEKSNLGKYLIEHNVAPGQKAVHVDILDEAAKDVFDTDLYYGENTAFDKRLQYIFAKDEASNEVLADFKMYAQERDSKYESAKVVTVDYFGDIGNEKERIVLDKKYHHNLLDTPAECGATDVFSVVDENGTEITKGIVIFCLMGQED